MILNKKSIAKIVAGLVIVFSIHGSLEAQESDRQVLVQDIEAWCDTLLADTVFIPMNNLIRELLSVDQAIIASLTADSDSLREAMMIARDTNSTLEGSQKTYLLYGGIAAGAVILVLIVVLILLLAGKGKTKKVIRNHSLANGELQSKLSKQAEEMAAQQKKTDAVKAESDLFIAELSDLKKKMTGLQADLTSVTNNLNQEKSEKENLQKQLTELRTKLEESENLKTELNTKIAAATRERDELKVRMETEYAVMVESNKKLNEEIQKLKEDLNLIRTESLQHQNLAANLKSELDKAAKERDELKTKMETEYAGLADANKQLVEEVNRLREENSKYEAGTAIMLEDLNRIRGESVQYHSLADSLKSELNQVESQMAEHDLEKMTWTEKLNSITNELSMLHMEKQRLTADLEDLSAHNLELAENSRSLSQQIAVLGEEMARSNQTAHKLSSQNQVLSQEVEKMRSYAEGEMQTRKKVDAELKNFVEELKGFLPLPK